MTLHYPPLARRLARPDWRHGTRLTQKVVEPVQQYILQRLLLNIPVIFLVITIVFAATHLQPDVAERRVAAGGNSSSNPSEFQAALKAARQQLGTDKPVLQQYGLYLRDILKGDFGESLVVSPGRKVTAELGDRLRPSIELGILQIIIALAIGVPIGVISAVRQDSWTDYLLRIFAVLGLAIPSFYLGTLFLLFSVRIVDWTPPLTTTAYKEIWEDPVANLQMMLLPALAGGFASAAVIMRLLRSQLLEVLRQDYVRTAWAKGLRERAVVTQHALRNALIPVVTILGLLIGILFGGNVVLESLFSIPGAGQYIVIALQQNDFPVVQGVVLIVAIALVMTNLVVDLAYAWLDPRIRYG